LVDFNEVERKLLQLLGYSFLLDSAGLYRMTYPSKGKKSSKLLITKELLK
jgi:hypothetical protein